MKGKRLCTEISSLAAVCSSLDLWLLFPVAFYTGFELTIFWFDYSRVSYNSKLNACVFYIAIKLKTIIGIRDVFNRERLCFMD